MPVLSEGPGVLMCFMILVWLGFFGLVWFGCGFFVVFLDVCL